MAGDAFKNGERSERGGPEDGIEEKHPEELGEDDLGVFDGGGGEGFECAHAELFGIGAHGDQGKTQDEGEPENGGCEEGLDDGDFGGEAVHQVDLHVKVVAGEEEEIEQNYVSDWGIEEGLNLAEEEGKKCFQE